MDIASYYYNYYGPIAAASLFHASDLLYNRRRMNAKREQTRAE